MKKMLREHAWFWWTYAIFLAIGVVIISSGNQMDVQLMLNKFHLPPLDYFFKYGTHLASGYSIVAFTVLFLFLKVKWGLLVGLSQLISAPVTQFLKRGVFDWVFRPGFYYEQMSEITPHLVEGVNLQHKFSFPSGHATAAFSLFFALALTTKNRVLNCFLALCAVIVSYSRVYISQHFMEDIIAGSLIGIMGALLAYFFIKRSLTNNTWMEKGFMK
ncbi:phosphatase PAP2 family protein [Salibacter halophilus]|nr:phosphatase PAP2 family protein [Salibacter halophilus]